MEDMNFITTQLVDKVKLPPKLLKNDFEKNIHTVLKEMNEGKCSKHGYIKRNSIKITTINLGKIEMHTFHGYTVFEVFFEASVCNPVIGSIVDCVVRNMNNFGILCSSGSNEGNEYIYILDVIIPKHTSNITSDVELSNINVGDDVKVEILGKKYQLNSVTISAIGKIITQTEQNTLSVERTTGLNIDIQDDESEDEIIDDSNTDDDEDEDDDRVMNDDTYMIVPQDEQDDYNNENNEDDNVEELSDSDSSESDSSHRET